MTKPVRIQRKRTAGWKMPPNTVTVSRPSIFGNPFTIESAINFLAGFGPVEGETPRALAVSWFARWLNGEKKLHPYNAKPPSRALIISELRGKNLACWCRLDQACHADVLLEFANQ